MTPLNRPRRRAEQFAALLDATAVQGALAGPAGDLDRELVQLLQLVAGLRDAPRTAGLDELATPRPAHTLQLRERLMAEATQVLTPERAERHAVLSLPPRTRNARERQLAAAAVVLVVLGGTTGMAAAAERSLPGQALYPVKRGIEHVDVVLSTSTAGRGRDVLHQASTRLDEVGDLAAGPTEGLLQIPGTMKEFARQAKQGTDLMLQAYAETSDPDTIQTVQDFAATEGTQVQALARHTPEVRESLPKVAQTLDEIQQATLDCDECPVTSVAPIVLSSVTATDTAPPVMRAADGSELGTGELPDELGAVPVTDGGTPAADGGGTVETLPGLDGSGESSPLPPVDGGVTAPDPTPPPDTAPPPDSSPPPDPTPPPDTTPPPDSSPPPDPTPPPDTTPPPEPSPSGDPTPINTPSASDPATSEPPSPDPSASETTAADPTASDTATSAAPLEVGDAASAGTPEAGSGDGATAQPAG